MNKVDDNTVQFIQDRQTRYKKHRKRMDRERFEREERAWMAYLPQRILNLTIKTHTDEMELLRQIQNTVWSDHDTSELVEETMDLARKEYENDLRECYKRLGWKTTDGSAPVKNIQWMEG